MLDCSLSATQRFDISFAGFSIMKAGAWYMWCFVVAALYFYVYAVNYFRGVRADDDVDAAYERRWRVFFERGLAHD